MKTRRRLAAALLGLLALDWVVVLVTGGWSPLQPGGDVSPRGMATRAIALGVLLLLRFRLWADDGRRMGVGRLTLLLLLLPALVQLHGSSGKLSGDGTSYYVFLRSLVKDRDFDLANEYDHFGMLSRWDLKGETNTGLRRSI
ncbi:MAG TPA: hypothetical protein VIC87_06850, partial [Vicinamibacteria bacterium]